MRHKNRYESLWKQVHIYTELESLKANRKDLSFDSNFRYRTMKDIWDSPYEEDYWLEVEINAENFNIVKFG